MMSLMITLMAQSTIQPSRAQVSHSHLLIQKRVRRPRDPLMSIHLAAPVRTKRRRRRTARRLRMITEKILFDYENKFA
jgi:hypothetical protein